MNDDALLGLHRELVEIPSVSHDETRIAGFLAARLAAEGADPTRFGNNLYAVCGRGPLLCFNTHVDTVPASSQWTRPPYRAEREEGRVYGLGANDAKASVAAMTAAFLRLGPRAEALGVRLILALVADEETGGAGAEVLLPELARRGLEPQAAVIGEPTALDIAVAQKGLLVLELRAAGAACHAAHGRALGARNPLRAIARDLVALEAVDLGPDDPRLGAVTLEPTVLQAGTARNMIPAEATCVLDVRTNHEPPPEAIIERLRAAVAGDVVVVSQRFRPCAVEASDPIVRAAQRARPEAQLIGSRGVSDWVFFEGIPAVKAGPGRTERSHKPDEFVEEREIVAGARFYEGLAVAYAEIVRGKEGGHDATLGSRRAAR